MDEASGGMMGLSDLDTYSYLDGLESNPHDNVDDDIDIDVDVDGDAESDNNTNLVFRGATDPFSGAQKSDGLVFTAEEDGEVDLTSPLDPEWGLTPRPRKVPAPRSRKQTMFVESAELQQHTKAISVSPVKSQGQKPKSENKSKVLAQKANGSSHAAVQKKVKKKVSREENSDDSDDGDDVVLVKVVAKRDSTAVAKPSAAKKRRTIPKRTHEDNASLQDANVAAAATVAATAAAKAAVTASTPRPSKATPTLSSEKVAEMAGGGDAKGPDELKKLKDRVQALDNQLNRSIQHRSQAQAQLAREREVHTKGLQLQKEQQEEAMGKLATMHEQAFKAERHEHERAFKLERTRYTTLVAEQKKSLDATREAEASKAPAREQERNRLQQMLDLTRKELERCQQESAAAEARGGAHVEEQENAHAGALAEMRRAFDAEKLRWAREFDVEASRRQQMEREHLVEKLRWAREWELAMGSRPHPTPVGIPEHWQPAR
jgi:hypothetical protein